MIIKLIRVTPLMIGTGIEGPPTEAYIGQRRGIQLHRLGTRLHIALLGRHLLGRTALLGDGAGGKARN